MRISEDQPTNKTLVMTQTTKIAFKGFDKDLKCRGEQFSIGSVFSKPITAGCKPTLCTDQGYHYCDNLKDVFSYYPDKDGNRFCEIEVLGPETSDAYKSISTTIKILRELSREEVKAIRYRPTRTLQIVKKLQQTYPHFIIGGSVALYLHGVLLDRWINDSKKDIDIITPYYTLIQHTDDINVTNGETTKSSGCDFDYATEVGGIKVDVLIDPKARYEVKTCEGVHYKVVPLLKIVEAKLRYALAGNDKHTEDLIKMLKSK